MRQCERWNEHNQLIDFQSGRPGTMRSMMFKKTNSSRRGVTLLFVLTLIVLFLLMGASFVLIANQFRRSAVVLGRIKVRRDDARTLVNRAFYDVFRGPSLDDIRSPLRGHSILEDMYGYGLQGQVTTLALRAGTTQLYNLQIANPQRVLDQSNITFTDANGYYAGHLVTFVNGQSAGTTCQVVAYEGATQTFVIRPTWRDSQVSLGAPLVANPNDRLIINGRPFSGTGAGGFTGSAPGVPALGVAALLPNRSVFNERRAAFINNYLGNSGNYDYRSVNEDYDAADYQNMFLSGYDSTGNLIPSFHRNSLYAYHSSPNSVHPSVFDAFAFQNGFNLTGSGELVVDNDNDPGNTPDGIWMDIALPIQTDVKGRVYKPLVSYLIKDMDGRLNLNVHGNPTELDPNKFVTTRDALYGAPVISNGRTGRGHGVGEVSLSEFGTATGDPALPNKMMLGGAGFPGRYGYAPTDTVPGVVGVRDDSTGLKFATIPVAGSLTGNSYSSSADIQGRFKIGVSANTPFIAGVPLGMPVVDPLASSLVEGVDFAYESDITPSPYTPVFAGTAKDTHFSSKELEGFFRTNDTDSPSLPQRLAQLLNANAKEFVTTDSFDVPVPPRNMIQELNSKLTIADPTIRNSHINLYIAPEMMRGGKLNLNRSFDTYSGSGINERIVMARHLYILFLLLFEDRVKDNTGAMDVDYDVNGVVDIQDNRAFHREMAQWAVNIVDFRDSDSVMTGFEFDYTPWDGGWTDPLLLDGDLSTLPATAGYVFGCERPEMLITESFAGHDRRTEDLSSEQPAGQTLATGDTDFDNLLVPNPFVFFELYCPWTYSTNAAALPDNEVASSLYTGNQLNLAKMAGDDPVWRMVVTERDTIAPIKPFWDIDNVTDPYSNADFHRIVYFIRPANKVLGNPAHLGFIGPEVYYPSTGVAGIPRGGFAVVGSEGVAGTDPSTTEPERRTYFGRRIGATPLDPMELDKTRRICLQPAANLVKIWNWDPTANGGMGDTVVETRNCIAIPIGFNNNDATTPARRSLGVTDPLNGYAVAGVRRLAPIADGFQFEEDFPPNNVLTLDEPIDKTLETNNDWDQYLKEDGLFSGYRVVHLQRLANPDMPYDPANNPYRTVDVHAIDLLSFNGATSAVDTGADTNQSPPGTFPIASTSFERNENGDPNDPNKKFLRPLWREDVDGIQTVPAQATVPGDIHYFARDFDDSLGTMNDFFIDTLTTETFPWLNWNNRPFESHLELTMVPMTKSATLLCKFDCEGLNNLRDKYQPEFAKDSRGATWYSTNFGNLPNFYGDSASILSDPVTNSPPPPPSISWESLNLQMLLDYVEVPSRFNGTETFLNAEFNNVTGFAIGLNYPNNAVSNFRYPGKINLNTLFGQPVYQALMGADYGTIEVAFPNFLDSRNGPAPTPPSSPTDFPWVFRSAEAVNYVPIPSLIYSRNGISGVTSGPTLFRHDPADMIPNPTDPLFDLDTVVDAKDPTRSAYFENEMRQRLGNLVTTRSSVFAIWITVGFFEVDPVTGNPIATGELEDQEGRRQRYRGFFIVDRSIPVACEPGENHNVDRAVLTESIWEENN
jgi:hypothetical protein